MTPTSTPATTALSGARLPGNLRVGVDLVLVGDVEAALLRHGDRYAQRIFTERELEDTAGRSRAAGLAARFAAKEAAIKALSPDEDVPGWRCIEVRRLPSGQCTLVLRGVADRLARAAGLDEWAVSLSHEGAVAVAVVLASQNDPFAPSQLGRALRQTNPEGKQDG